MPELPTGTVTFLFSDIESETKGTEHVWSISLPSSSLTAIAPKP